MEEVLAFLKKAGYYFLATQDGDQPRNRPFGTIHAFEGKLYFQTGKVKPVFAQLMANPKVELSACVGGTQWVRITATAVRDERREPKASLLEDYPSLKGAYSPDDGNCEVFYLKDVTALFASFTEKPHTVTF